LIFWAGCGAGRQLGSENVKREKVVFYIGPTGADILVRKGINSHVLSALKYVFAGFAGIVSLQAVVEWTWDSKRR
jgi:hypothetical protein